MSMRFLLLIAVLLSCRSASLAQVSKNDEVEILKAFAKYCNRVCVSADRNEYDQEVRDILISVNHNKKKSLKRALRNFYKRKINLHKVSNEIFNYRVNRDWNDNVQLLSSLFDSSDCKYQFSIMKPIEIEKGEVLLILAEYKYDRGHNDFDAMVHFFSLKKIQNIWTVTFTEYYYEIFCDWHLN